MRPIFLALIASLVISSAFARDFDLNAENVQLGSLEQNDFQTAHELLNVVRTSDTPAEVVLNYSIKVQETVCVRWEYRPVWIPGHYENVCQVINGQQVCHSVYKNGYYEYQQVCVKTQEVMSTDDKKLYLNFKKAQKLEGNAREVFALEFNQKHVRNDNHDIKASKIEGAQDYEINETTILGFKRTLKFKAQ